MERTSTWKLKRYPEFYRSNYSNLTDEEYLEKVLRPKYEFRGSDRPYKICQELGLEVPDWAKDCKLRYKRGQIAFSPYDCMKYAEAKAKQKYSEEV